PWVLSWSTHTPRPSRRRCSCLANNSASNLLIASSTSWGAALFGLRCCAPRLICASTHDAASIESLRVSLATARTRQASVFPSTISCHRRGNRWATSIASPSNWRAECNGIRRCPDSSEAAYSLTTGAPSPASATIRSGSWRNAFVASVKVTASYRPARWLARRSSSTCSRWTRSREARMASHTSALPKFSRSSRSSMLRSSHPAPTPTSWSHRPVAQGNGAAGEVRAPDEPELEMVGEAGEDRRPAAHDAGLDDELVLLDEAPAGEREGQLDAADVQPLPRLVLEPLHLRTEVAAQQLGVRVQRGEGAGDDVRLGPVDGAGERRGPGGRDRRWIRVAPGRLHHLVGHPAEDQGVGASDRRCGVPVQLLVGDPDGVVVAA